MQNTASLPADQFRRSPGPAPHDLDLDALARQTKAIERKRKIDQRHHLLRLALARGPGGLSLSATAAWATMLGFPDMSDPGVKYRLDKAVGFLNAVMTSQLAAKSTGRQRALARPYPARLRRHLHQQARQHGDRLAGARGVRSRARRLLPTWS